MTGISSNEKRRNRAPAFELPAIEWERDAMAAFSVVRVGGDNPPAFANVSHSTGLRAARRSAVEPGLSALRRRVKSYVEARLDDPELSIDAIAAAIARSRRYLHKAFASEPETLSEMIWRLRLERSARELRSAEMADRSITDIAFASGFNSSPHFSRAFRARYGMAPRDWRKRRDPIPGCRVPRVESTE